MPRLGGQTKGAHAVDQAEVDDLGVAALLARDLVRAHAEDLAGGGAVHVQPSAKARSRFPSSLMWAMMLLDLRIVGAGWRAPAAR